MPRGIALVFLQNHEFARHLLRQSQSGLCDLNARAAAGDDSLRQIGQTLQLVDERIEECLPLPLELRRRCEFRPLGDLPLVVLTRGRPNKASELPVPVSQELLDEQDRIWKELQQELAALSGASSHRIVPNSGHSIPIDAPDAVVAAVNDLLDGAVGYNVKAMIVLTDGNETEPKYLADLMPDQLHSRIFAIGVGTPENIQPSALATLTGATDGYLLMTGEIDTDDTFLLTKYYQQILAGITNTEIVVDPQGMLSPGGSLRA